MGCGEGRGGGGGWRVFFFNDTATTEIYTLSLHDALPIFTELIEDVKREIARVISNYKESAIDQDYL